MSAAHPASLEADKLRMSQLQDLLTLGFRWMKFPAGLEHQFLSQDPQQRLRHFIISGLISLLVYDGFLVADYLLIPDVFSIAVRLRLLIFTPIALVALVVLWVGRDKPLMQHPVLLDSAVLVSGLFAAATLAYALSITHSPLSDFYHAGFAVVVMYGNLVQRLRFWSALGFSLAVLAIQVVGVVVLPNFNPRLVLPICSLTAATVAFSLCANYVMERDKRRRYLLSERERALVKDLREVNLKLQELSRVDVLTALFNRRHFQEYLQDLWQRAKHGGTEVVIIMMDVDHFKPYNDHHGHPAGDECLRQVASVMHNSLRQPGDMVARYGGEEFIAVLPNTSLALAMQAAERLRKAVQDMAMPHETSPTLPVVTVSLGVACCNAATPGATPDGLISKADRALYEAKHQGRNRVCSL
ncbi:GGDEF domain-containing protein [Aquabacterium sp.]|uniref:GGDEF domain-containing protein n=1 Tax=Aquabacterium sp. TaxID=1872578 RepID=UPI002486D3CA|nr:GGDEF domain-containing protein [Aquabacterium sp.]MDI1259094.1 GGDEF domain-containing protein [Aquabacterium sp.]